MITITVGSFVGSFDSVIIFLALIILPCFPEAPEPEITFLLFKMRLLQGKPPRSLIWADGAPPGAPQLGLSCARGGRGFSGASGQSIPNPSDHQGRSSSLSTVFQSSRGRTPAACVS